MLGMGLEMAMVTVVLEQDFEMVLLADSTKTALNLNQLARCRNALDVS